MIQTRRQLLLTAGASALAGPAFAEPVPHARDWAWLEGEWQVSHKRLRERLAGSDAWDEFGGRSMFWQVMGGLGNVDDDILDLPSGEYRGMSVRAFDPRTGTWAIWWVDSRNPTVIEAPVRGGFAGEVGTFEGEDTFKGRPITVRFRWRDVHGPRPWWEQAFSTDKGSSWEVNWRNWFTRVNAKASPLPRIAGAPTDFDFLHGRWSVMNRRRKADGSWEGFASSLTNWPVLGGQGNVGDNLFHGPSGDRRGLSIRTFDPESRQWSSWWLDGRNPAEIGTPQRGAFSGGVGTLIGEDVRDGRPTSARARWSRITAASAFWEQAVSTDGGASWETNWTAEFSRLA